MNIKYYDPYEHRIGNNLISNHETFVTLIKGSIGTGILAMPMAFKDGGFLGGCIYILLIALLLSYSIQLLINSVYELSKQKRVPSLSYPEALQEALKIGPSFLRCFSSLGQFMVKFLLVVCQFGICCVYVIFVGENIKMLIDNRWDLKVNVRIILVCITPIFCTLNFLKDLKTLSIISSIANGFTFISLAIIVYFLTRQPFDLFKRELFGSLKNIPLFVGIVLYALEAIGVLITVENNMKHPEYFGGIYGIFNITYFSVTIMYLVIGLLGYIRYGPDVSDSITLNLPENELLAEIAQLLMVLAIIMSYALQCFVPIDIIWNNYLLEKTKHLTNLQQQFIEFSIRTGCAILTCGLAISIPLLHHVIALMGSLCLSILGIILPAFLEFCVEWNKSNNSFNKKIVKDIMIMLIGMLTCLIGSGVSILQITHLLQKNK